MEVKPKFTLPWASAALSSTLAEIKGSPLIRGRQQGCASSYIRVAQYGIRGRRVRVVPALEERIKELKG